MSILSLPDDNLIQIFKKMDATSIDTWKQTNSRFRKIIISKKLDYIDAQRLAIRCGLRQKPDGSPCIRWNLEVEIYNELLQKTFAKKKLFEISLKVPKEEVMLQVKEAFEQLKLKSVESIHFDDTYSCLDANLLFNDCDLDLSRLHSCTNSGYLAKLNFLDDNFFKNIVRSNPKKLNFSQCKTKATISGITEIVMEYFKDARPLYWYFGEIEMTKDDHRLLQKLDDGNCVVDRLPIRRYQIIRNLSHHIYQVIEFSFLDI